MLLCSNRVPVSCQWKKIMKCDSLFSFGHAQMMLKKCLRHLKILFIVLIYRMTCECSKHFQQKLVAIFFTSYDLQLFLIKLAEGMADGKVIFFQSLLKWNEFCYWIPIGQLLKCIFSRGNFVFKDLQLGECAWRVENLFAHSSWSFFLFHALHLTHQINYLFYALATISLLFNCFL